MQQQSRINITSCLLLIALIGCTGKQQTQYYLLWDSDSAPAVYSSAQVENCDLSMGYVTLPSYLDRTQLMIKTGSNTITAAQHHRWAETISDGVKRVLSNQLGLLEQQPGSLLLDLNIRHFHGSTNGEVELAADWQLRTRGSEAALVAAHFNETKIQSGVGYDSMVAGQRQLVVQLSNQIGQALANAQCQQAARPIASPATE